MANNSLYSLAYVTIDGALLTEHASVSVKRSTASQAVTTVLKGYAGESPGAPMVEIDVKNAVPSADFEFNPGPFMKKLKQVEIGVLVAGKKMIARGFIISDNFSHAVNGEAALDFQFRGSFVDYEA